MGLLGWAIVFFVVAIIAAILGFTGVYVAAAMIAKVLFWLFVALFIVFLVLGVARRGGPRTGHL